MFDTVFAGKTGIVKVRYAPETAQYEASLTVNGGDTKLFTNNDLTALFKETVKGGANEKLAMIAFRKFSQGMNLQLRELAVQRRNFNVGTKKVFLAIKAKSKAKKGTSKKFPDKKAEKAEEE